jgi:hypothetical protein
LVIDKSINIRLIQYHLFDNKAIGLKETYCISTVLNIFRSAIVYKFQCLKYNFQADSSVLQDNTCTLLPIYTWMKIRYLKHYDDLAHLNKQLTFQNVGTGGVLENAVISEIEQLDTEDKVHPDRILSEIESPNIEMKLDTTEQSTETTANPSEREDFYGRRKG